MPVTATLGTLTYNKSSGTSGFSTNPWIIGFDAVQDLVTFENNGNIWYLQTNINGGTVIKLNTNNIPILQGSKGVVGTDYANLTETVVSANATTDRFTITGNFNDTRLGMQVQMPVKFFGTTFGGVNRTSNYFLASGVPPTSNNNFQVSATAGGNVVQLTTASGSMTAQFVRNDSVGGFIGTDICYNNNDDSIYSVGRTSTVAPAGYPNRSSATYGVYNRFDTFINYINGEKILADTQSDTTLTPNTITRNVLPSTANSVILLNVNAADNSVQIRYKYTLQKVTDNAITYSTFLGNTNSPSIGGGANVDSNVSTLSYASNGNIIMGGARTLLTLVYGRNYDSFYHTIDASTGSIISTKNILGSGYSGTPSDMPGRITDAKDDGTGNIVVSLRQFEGNATPNSNPNVFPVVNSGSYVIKFDNAGNALYQQRYANLPTIDKLSVDANTSNVYFLSRYNSTTAYIGQFDNNGNIVWVNDIGVTGNTVFTNGILDLKYHANFLYVGQNLQKSGGDVGIIFFRVAANGALPGNANANATLTMSNTTFDFTYNQGNANSTIFASYIGNVQFSNTAPASETAASTIYDAPYSANSTTIPVVYQVL
jgi:hypothetical protein